MDENKVPKTHRALRKREMQAEMALKEERHSFFKKVTTILQKPPPNRSKDEIDFLHTCSDIVCEVKQRLHRRSIAKRRIEEFEETRHEIVTKSKILANYIRKAEHLVVYTGAGISTAARIPDYRGTNGIWTLLQRGKSVGSHDLSLADPTFTHMALSTLYHDGILKFVVSQNCDGLHLRSGLPRNALSEVHGNMGLEVCKFCKPHREYWRLFDVTENTGRFSHRTMRRCYYCNNALIDTIVHFGERGKLQWPLNWSAAIKHAAKADVIVCLGSSLKVLKKYPWLWQMNRPAKKRPVLCIVNLQWTPKDDLSVLKIHAKCDDVVAIVMQELGVRAREYNRIDDPIFYHATLVSSTEEHTKTQPKLKSVDDLEPEDVKEEMHRFATSNFDSVKDDVNVSEMKNFVYQFQEESKVEKPELYECLNQSKNVTDFDVSKVDEKYLAGSLTQLDVKMDTIEPNDEKIERTVNKSDENRLELKVESNDSSRTTLFDFQMTCSNINTQNISQFFDDSTVFDEEDFKNNVFTSTMTESVVPEASINDASKDVQEPNEANNFLSVNSNFNLTGKHEMDVKTVKEESTDGNVDDVKCSTEFLNPEMFACLKAQDSREIVKADDLTSLTGTIDYLRQLLHSRMEDTPSTHLESIYHPRMSHLINMAAFLTNKYKQLNYFESIDGFSNFLLAYKLAANKNETLYPFKTGFEYPGLFDIINLHVDRSLPFTRAITDKNESSNETGQSTRTRLHRKCTDKRNRQKDKAQCEFCSKHYATSTCQFYRKHEPVFRKCIYRASKHSCKRRRVVYCECCDVTSSESEGATSDDETLETVRKRTLSLNEPTKVKAKKFDGETSDVSKDLSDESKDVSGRSNDHAVFSVVNDGNVGNMTNPTDSDGVELFPDKTSELSESSRVQPGWFGKGYRVRKTRRKKR